MLGWFRTAVPTVLDRLMWWNDDPPGEADKVRRIKSLCGAGLWNANNLLEPYQSQEILHRERTMYLRKRDAALALARELTDPKFRDSALRSIIDMCMVADDVEAARPLMTNISNEEIKERLAQDYPALVE
jgi:hypothetical protein